MVNAVLSLPVLLYATVAIPAEIAPEAVQESPGKLAYFGAEILTALGQNGMLPAQMLGYCETQREGRFVWVECSWAIHLHDIDYLSAFEQLRLTWPTIRRAGQMKLDQYLRKASVHNPARAIDPAKPEETFWL